MKTGIKRMFGVVVVIAVLVSLVPAMGATAAQPKVNFWLTVLHNNDAESKLINLGTGLEDFGGAARFKTLVDMLKTEATIGIPNMPPAKRAVIMVSSGDNFLAGPEFSVSLDKGVPYYDTIAMDMIGYDAIAIGNHDFDFGPDVLANFISGFTLTQPTYLSANLDFSGEPVLQDLKDDGRIASSTVIKYRGEDIGIIGVTTPALPYITSPRNVDPDVVGAVQDQADMLTEQGVKYIVLISHLQSIEEDLSIIPSLSDVDIVVAGGGDEILANPGDLLIPGDEALVYGAYPLWADDSDGVSVPVVTTAGSYAYVGRLVAGFDKDGHLLTVDEEDSGPVRVAGGANTDAVAPDPIVQSEVVEPLTEALAQMAANVVGTSEVPLDGIRADVRSKETNEGNLIADSLKWQGEQLAASFGVPTPDVALQNGGGIRNNSIIPAGDITELDTFSMVPFANFVSIVPNIPRDQFKEILENAVSRVEFGDGRFAQVSGFSFTWDPAGTAQVEDVDGNILTPGTRVVSASLDDGTPLIIAGVVVPGDALSIATIDFNARGGDQYPYHGAAFTTLGVTYQQALENYISTGLSGVITAGDYPVGGEGRITQVP
jgi:2',3'-cyclic-nucleotide 2'-phosphodiesterase (5'-nucleotidase family)